MTVVTLNNKKRPRKSKYIAAKKETGGHNKLQCEYRNFTSGQVPLHQCAPTCINTFQLPQQKFINNFEG
jgi:hypothetical protein